MNYQVIDTADTSVEIWDGKSRDPDHPGEKAGVMNFIVGAGHGFSVGDEVDIIIRKRN
jgi:hypothetical protein